MSAKVFVAGAGGAIGQQLVPLLIERGHKVTAMTRSPQKAATLQAMGAETVAADGLNRDAVWQAVLAAKPDVIVHEMTGLSGVTNYKHFDREFELTNRLRTEGLDYLQDAGRKVGARQIVAQSFGNWNYQATGGPAKTEDDPLEPNPPASMRRSLEAVQYLESRVLGAQDVDGVVLRYANLYGPATAFASDGALATAARQRQLPIIGSGAGIWSFIHVADAASATLAAIERGGSGLYNVADDEPAPVAAWLPEFAKAVGAKSPMRVPALVGRIAAGESGIRMFTQMRGASNEKAKRELPWRLLYPSWRDGFRTALG